MKFILTSVFLVLAISCGISYCFSLDDSLVKDFLADIRVPVEESSSSVEPRADLLVTIRNGTLRGRLGIAGVGAELHSIYVYTKIPYAKPPIEELRFRPPETYNGWGDEILNATQQAPACAQFFTAISQPASEDCLFVNVFSPRPANETGPPLPVMVFIHGGAFFLGESSYYPPRKLLAARSDFIYVAIQYRLGAFGFFSTGDPVAPGNMGMKDMVKSLEWVQENIGAFGGNPNDVTIAGESAGAASVVYMMISPLARGLFHKVIAMSGSAISEWAIDRNPVQSSNRLATQLGCPTSSSLLMVNCLRALPWTNISVQVLENALVDISELTVSLKGIVPVIEGDVPTAFLPDDPLVLLKNGPLPDVPVILGTVQHEGSFPLSGFYFLTLEPQGKVNDTEYMHDSLMSDLLAPFGLNENFGGSSVSQSVGFGFIPGANRENFTEMTDGLIDMMSVLFMKGSVLKTADILSRRLTNVYLYNVDHVGRNSLFHLIYVLAKELLGGEIPPMEPGIMHGDDLQYMFPLPFVHSAEDVAFSRIYCKLWTNFVVHGNPTPEETESYPVWPSYSIRSPKYMRLNAAPAVGNDYTEMWHSRT